MPPFCPESPPGFMVCVGLLGRRGTGSRHGRKGRLCRGRMGRLNIWRERGIRNRINCRRVRTSNLEVDSHAERRAYVVILPVERRESISQPIISKDEALCSSHTQYHTLHKSLPQSVFEHKRALSIRDFLSIGVL